MEKIILEKNRLDLAYKRNLQLLNIVLIVGIGSFAAYFASLVLNFDKILQYTALLIIITFTTLFFYRRIDDRLKEISERIEELKD